MGMVRSNTTMETSYEIPDIDVSDIELVSHVRDALKSATEGDLERYIQLIAVINNVNYLSPDDVALCVTSLRALAATVSHIDMLQHEALLTTIFRMNMWNFSPDVMDALVELIISLAGSSGKFVDSCLEMLVYNFTPPESFLNLMKQPRGISRKYQVLDRVHSALKNISDLVPLAPSRLIPIILQRMPHMSKREGLHVLYVESMLRLESSSLGELVGSTMLMAVVDKLVDLDVEITWDDILLDDSSKGIFDLELEDVEETADYTETDSIEGRQGLKGNLVAEKLDNLMVLTCEHLKSCLDSGRLIKVFETLLESFQVTVLNAYRSKFAQFVIFYACSLDPENCGMGFAFTLADIFVCSTNPPLTRMSAVAYLASYLSRGRFLESSFILSTLQRLVDWCHEYCRVQDFEERSMNPGGHRVFYSACQAIMYVLCFRMKGILDVRRLKIQLLDLPLRPILQHSLDPLKVCLPSIVQEFLRQTKAAGLFTVSKDFLFNNLIDSDLSRAFGGRERLDTFFPFDPCLLRKSDSLIRPNFLFWSMVRTTCDDDEDMNSDDEDIDEHADNITEGGDESSDDDVMGRNYNDLDLELENSLHKMSITPKSTLKYDMVGGFNMPMRMPARIRPSTSPPSL